jgi:hypothetical protein
MIKVTEQKLELIKTGPKSLNDLALIMLHKDREERKSSAGKSNSKNLALPSVSNAAAPLPPSMTFLVNSIVPVG